MPFGWRSRSSGTALPERTYRGSWDNPFELLRQKWYEVPGGSGADGRLSTDELLKMPIDHLVRIWEQRVESATTGAEYSVRGWYHDLYRDVFRGKRVLDVGSGFGMDGITFALAGAEMTFVDIVESNLAVLRRICEAKGLRNVRFHYLEDFSSFDELDDGYDVIWCQGSLINAPFDVIRREIQLLLEHLVPGGRWIELAYPKARWEREGRMPFSRWGEKTDAGAPWMEWYDLDKLRAAFAPVEFDVILYFEFHNRDFNWFDLKVRR